jgi:hypothetical protein
MVPLLLHRLPPWPWLQSTSSIVQILHQLPSPFYCPNPVTLSETHSYTMLMLSELNLMYSVSHTIKIQIKLSQITPNIYHVYTWVKRTKCYITYHPVSNYTHLFKLQKQILYITHMVYMSQNMSPPYLWWSSTGSRTPDTSPVSNR